MIRVTLTYAGKQLDLLVPGAVTFGRLSQLIRDGFAARGTVLPEGLSLVLHDKPLAVSPHDRVAAFGFGNGDRLQISTEGE